MPPAPPEKDVPTEENPGKEKKSEDGASNQKADVKQDDPAGDQDNASKAQTAPEAGSELTPEIKQKLRKLEKLEKTYPGECGPGDHRAASCC